MERFERIANLAQLAAVLEVSTEKPGNVTPTHDFPDTTYEDFIFGSIAIAPAIKNAALNGFRAGNSEISLKGINIGENIKNAILDVKKSHPGGNTHLGMLMLFIPIASGAGFCISHNSEFSHSLRENITKILENSTVKDSLNLYSAIKISNAGGLMGRLREPRIPFHNLMEISSSGDRIAEELTNGMRITFEIGVPTLDRVYRETRNLRKAILQTYLVLLSEFPDTFIARKSGSEKAKVILREAQKILEKGGIFTKAGISAIEELNINLRREGNKLNPGTTADLVAAALFVWLLLEKFQ